MPRIKRKDVPKKLLQRLTESWSVLGLLLFISHYTEQTTPGNLSEIVPQGENTEVPITTDGLSSLEISTNISETNYTSGAMKLVKNLEGSKISKSNVFKSHDIPRTSEKNSSSFNRFVSVPSDVYSNELESTIQYEGLSDIYNATDVSILSPKTSDTPEDTEPPEQLVESYTSPDPSRSSRHYLRSFQPDGITSCRDRCGDDRSSPCSCSEICLVNGNCCSDLEIECPTLARTGRSKFSHLLQVEVECSSATNTFMVVSCPGGLESNKHVSHKDSINRILATNHDNATVEDQSEYPVSQTDESSLGPDVQFTQSFFSLVLGAPITDLSTSLVFKNRSIALCNGVNQSDILPWKVIVRLVQTEKPKNLEDIEKFTDSRVFLYTAPDIPETSAGSPCLQKAIDQCAEQWVSVRPELRDLCFNGGITYYSLLEFKPASGAYRTMFYKNFYCLLCSTGSDEGASPVADFSTTGRTFRLSLVASFSSSGLLEISKVSSNIKSFSTWDALKCSISTTDQGELQCRDFECDKDTEIKVEDSCKKFAQVQFAISSGNCIFDMSQIMEKKLFTLIKCYLETFDNAIFKTGNARFDTVYDKRLSLPLLRMFVDVYYKSLRFAVQRSQIWTDLALLVRSAGFPCSPVPVGANCTDNSCQIGDLLMTEVATVEASGGTMKKNILNQEENPNGVPTDPKIIICESKVFVNKREIDNLVCYQVNDEGSSQFQPLEMAAQVPCFGGQLTQRMRNGVFPRLPGRCLVFSLLVSVFKLIIIHV
ncbi:hypothetical protein EGW08_021235 [Elysia chlorotica]|uniref:SMB domain-containing protein n=1 Tax=Elysia chlorotica TaxID=188477 RepID=A0A433SP63_ELYCH|nr:hypothetical protein EGW08_021235 [Elysia chlorotica]